MVLFSTTTEQAQGQSRESSYKDIGGYRLERASGRNVSPRQSLSSAPHVPLSDRVELHIGSHRNLRFGSVQTEKDHARIL